jgi:hypothetical protein
MVTDLAKVIAVVNVVDSTFTDNYFTGEGSSLIYIQNGLISLRGNTFRNNGQIVSDQIYTIDGRFMHKYYQEHGVVWVNNTGSSQLPRNSPPHTIESNVFRYLFAEFGVATIMSQNQEVLMSKNTYQHVISLKSGAILNTKGYKEFTTIMIQNETVDSIYAKTGGTVMVESEEPGLVNLIVRNTVFKNMRSSGGSAL